MFWLLTFSLYIGRFNIDIGFSLKPYMLVISLIFLLTLKKISIHKMLSFELFMVIFVLMHSMTAANFNYPNMSIRFIVLYLIIFIFYFSGRFLTTNLEIKQIERVISITGIIGVIISLAYYSMGLLASGMNFYGGNIDYFGLLIDRSTPRLTGAASNDPNIFVFYVTLYFFFTITNLSEKLNKVGFILVSLAIIFGLIVLFLTSSGIKTKIRAIATTMGFGLLLYSLGSRMPLNPIDYITSRFSNSFTDGGSGRVEIWSNAFDTFRSNPVLGIGINSIREYNLENYSRGVYVHNSLIEVLVETGIIGFSLYMVFWILLLKAAYSLFKKQKKSKYILISLLAIFIQMNSLSVLYNEGFYFVIILVFRYSMEYITEFGRKKSGV